MTSSALISSPAFRALLDRLIPPDDFPGALDAGVANYIARQLETDCARETAVLHDGLARLDAEAVARTGRSTSFVGLNAGEQDELIAALERGEARTVWPLEMPAAAFIDRMVNLAHEGFYADPGNGANRDAISWRMIGYDPRLPKKGSAKE